MKITEEEKRKIEKFIHRKEIKRYLHESKDQREIRKYREKYENYNRDDGCERCDFGATHKNRPYKYIKNGDEWETENIIFKKNNKHWWENHDKKHIKTEKKETCILYEDGEIIVINAIIEFHHREKSDIYEPDKIEDYIYMKIPKYKMRFQVNKIRDFSKLPKKIIMKGEKYDVEELAKAILATGKNIYEVK